MDVSARAGKAPAGTSAQLLERDARRRSRLDPETPLADLLIHPDMDCAASPRSSYFARAQIAGESAARALLPGLLEQLQKAHR